MFLQLLQDCRLACLWQLCWVSLLFAAVLICYASSVMPPFIVSVFPVIFCVTGLCNAHVWFRVAAGDTPGAQAGSGLTKAPLPPLPPPTRIGDSDESRAAFVGSTEREPYRPGRFRDEDDSLARESPLRAVSNFSEQIRITAEKQLPPRSRSADRAGLLRSDDGSGRELELGPALPSRTSQPNRDEAPPPPCFEAPGSLQGREPVQRPFSPGTRSGVAQPCMKEDSPPPLPPPPPPSEPHEPKHAQMTHLGSLFSDQAIQPRPPPAPSFPPP